MWIASKAVSLLRRASSQHQQGPTLPSPTAQQATDTETSCSSTSASRRDSLDLQDGQADTSGAGGVDVGDEAAGDPYDEKVQGYRIAEYPALRGAFAVSHPSPLQLKILVARPQTSATSKTRPPLPSPNPYSKPTPANSHPRHPSTATRTRTRPRPSTPPHPSPTRARTSFSGYFTSTRRATKARGSSSLRAAPRPVSSSWRNALTGIAAAAAAAGAGNTGTRTRRIRVLSRCGISRRRAEPPPEAFRFGISRMVSFSTLPPRPRRA